LSPQYSLETRFEGNGAMWLIRAALAFGVAIASSDGVLD
jgi:hypothetical protein